MEIRLRFWLFGRIRHRCNRRGNHDNQINGEQPNRARPRHFSAADFEIVIPATFYAPGYACSVRYDRGLLYVSRAKRRSAEILAKKGERSVPQILKA
jgi:hypothetical protein